MTHDEHARAAAAEIHEAAECDRDEAQQLASNAKQGYDTLRDAIGMPDATLPVIIHEWQAAQQQLSELRLRATEVCLCMPFSRPESVDRLEAALAATGPQPANKGNTMSIELNHSQAQQLLSFFGGQDSQVTVEEYEEGPCGRGLYAYCTDYPGDGSILLDPAVPARKTAWEIANDLAHYLRHNPCISQEQHVAVILPFVETAACYPKRTATAAAEVPIAVNGVGVATGQPPGEDVENEPQDNPFHQSEPPQVQVGKTPCPDCGRPKAASADDIALGYCPKWYAVRDADADADCKRLVDYRKQVAEPVAGKTPGQVLTTEQLAEIANRDALSNGERNHVGLCGIRGEDRRQCKVCEADDSATEDRTLLLQHIAAAQAVRSMPGEPRWIPVGESVPSTHRTVLVKTSRQDDPWVAYFSGGWQSAHGHDSLRSVTHWMEIPGRGIGPTQPPHPEPPPEQPAKGKP